jgi:hypothetical protein
VIYGTLAAWLAKVPLRFATIEGLGYVFTPTLGAEPFRRKILRTVVVLLSTLALSRAEDVFFLNKILSSRATLLYIQRQPILNK